MTTGRAFSALALAGTVVLTVAGCGSGASTQTTTADSKAASSASPSSSADPFAGQTANQIVTDAQNAMLAADSVELKGFMVQSGNSMAIDLTMARSGGCQGTIGLGSKGKMTIVVLGKTVWMKFDRTFLDAHGAAAAAPKLLGKYLKTTTADQRLASFASFCDLTAFAKAGTSGGDAYTKGPVTQDGTQQALTLIDSTDKSSVLVTVAAPHRVIRMVGPTPADGSVAVSYGVTSTITPPPASTTINASKFGM